MEPTALHARNSRNKLRPKTLFVDAGDVSGPLPAGAVPAQHRLPLADPAGFAAMVGELVDHLEGAPASPALHASRVH